MNKVTVVEGNICRCENCDRSEKTEEKTEGGPSGEASEVERRLNEAWGKERESQARVADGMLVCAYVGTPQGSV